MYASPGNSIFLSVGAIGSAPLKYQWQLNGRNIPNATNSTYVINNVTVGYSGNYTAVVSNAFGSAISAEVPVTIVQQTCCDNKTWDFQGPCLDLAMLYTFECPGPCQPYPCNGAIGQVWPTTRYGHAMALENLFLQVASGSILQNSMIMFGGVDFNGIYDNNTWRWVSGQWTILCPLITMQAPPARAFHAMDYDSWRGKTVMFGGQGASDLLDDAWEWDGNRERWTPVPLPPGGVINTGPRANWPPARLGHAMAYDSTHHRTVLFGGAGDGGVLLNDTWLRDGAAWIQGPAAPSGLTARQGHAMIYDNQLQAVVLVGGSDGQPENDMWEWDGNSWTELLPSSATPSSSQPSQRAGHAMAYDPDCGRILLFGGFDINGQPLNDTWQYDDVATSWSATSLAAMPAARGSYISARGWRKNACPASENTTSV